MSGIKYVDDVVILSGNASKILIFHDHYNNVGAVLRYLLRLLLVRQEFKCNVVAEPYGQNTP